MNTSKTQDLKSFRMNTYEKRGGGYPAKWSPFSHAAPGPRLAGYFSAFRTLLWFTLYVK